MCSASICCLWRVQVNSTFVDCFEQIELISFYSVIFSTWNKNFHVGIRIMITFFQVFSLAETFVQTSPFSIVNKKQHVPRKERWVFQGKKQYSRIILINSAGHDLILFTVRPSSSSLNNLTEKKLKGLCERLCGFSQSVPLRDCQVTSNHKFVCFFNVM